MQQGGLRLLSDAGESGQKGAVTVRLKRGSWEIEITCAPDRVQQAVESVLAGMSSKEPAVMTPAGDAESVGGQDRKFGTCRGLLISMWKEGWFGAPKQLSEVHEELARRG